MNRVHLWRFTFTRPFLEAFFSCLKCGYIPYALGFYFPPLSAHGVYIQSFNGPFKQHKHVCQHVFTCVLQFYMTFLQNSPNTIDPNLISLFLAEADHYSHAPKA